MYLIITTVSYIVFFYIAITLNLLNLDQTFANHQLSELSSQTNHNLQLA